MSAPTPRLSFFKLALARLRFVAVFLVAALVVGYWDTIKTQFDKWTRPRATPDLLVAASDIEFYCPMHPNVIRQAPGSCPVCGMPLVKRRRGEKTTLPQDVLARVQLTPQRIALAGIITESVEYRPLVRTVRAVGVLDYDETRLSRLSARVAGRVDRLFIQYTGQAVKEGDPVYSLYSPEVYTATREYLQARKRVNEMMREGVSATAATDMRTDASAVYNAAMQKLVLWGLTPKQLDEIDREFDATGQVPTDLTITSPIAGIAVRKEIQQGQYVQTGDSPFTIADLSTLWLQAKLYERDIPLVQLGQAVTVTVDALPDESFTGTVTFRSFQLDPQTRTLDARVELPNPNLRLRPGMFAQATVRVPLSARPAATQPTPKPAAPSIDPAKVYRDALTSYFEAQQRLAADSTDDVPKLLDETAAQLELLPKSDALAEESARVAAAARSAKGQAIDALRGTFGEASDALINIGKAIGIPESAEPIEIFRCPMTSGRQYWLQPTGPTTNPFMGKKMLTCGSAVAPLPREPKSPAASATQPTTAPAGSVLSVPRSAVIDTGERTVVFVESDPGRFDMRAVTLGPLGTSGRGEELYPVLHGLNPGEHVATNGAFLIDAENRLNPAK